MRNGAGGGELVCRMPSVTTTFPDEISSLHASLVQPAGTLMADFFHLRICGSRHPLEVALNETVVRPVSWQLRWPQTLGNRPYYLVVCFHLRVFFCLHVCFSQRACGVAVCEHAPRWVRWCPLAFGSTART